MAVALSLVLPLRTRPPSPAPSSADELYPALVAPVDSLRHLLRARNSGFASALRAVVRDSKSFRQLWAEAVRGEPRAPMLPPIDFERDMVIFAATGSMPSTGFGITIDSVIVREPSLEVHEVLSSPGSLCLQSMELTNPAIDFIGLARSLGIEGQRAKTVKDTTDLIAKALKDGTALLIDVDMERNYKPM